MKSSDEVQRGLNPTVTLNYDEIIKEWDKVSFSPIRERGREREVDHGVCKHLLISSSTKVSDGAHQTFHNGIKHTLVIISNKPLIYYDKLKEILDSGHSWCPLPKGTYIQMVT